MALGSLNWCDETRLYRGIENSEDPDLTAAPDGTVMTSGAPTRVYPCMIFVCQLAHPVRPNWKGLWVAKLQVQVWSNRTKTKGDTHDERAQEGFSLFTTQTIARDLSGSIQGFRVAAVLPSIEGQGYLTPGKAWMSYMNFDLEHACTFDL